MNPAPIRYFDCVSGWIFVKIAYSDVQAEMTRR